MAATSSSNKLLSKLLTSDLFILQVRYESRKKLAEQRPRIKGQFVRQVPPDPPPKSDHSGGNSAAN